MKTVKYVVLLEIPRSGYIDCIAICDSIDEAFGHAYLQLCEDRDEEKYYIMIPMQTEGENGFSMECRFKGDDSIYETARVVIYRQEDKEN